MKLRHPHVRWTRITLCIALLSVMLVFATSLKAQTTPSLTLVSPQDGATVDGPVTIRVTHSGFRFDGLAINKDPAPGTGHWHVYVDGKYAGLGVSNVIEIPNEAYPSISAGQHTLTISLHQNNHALTNPPVQHNFKLNFSKDVSIPPATSGPPSLTLVSPQDGATVDGPVTIHVTHSGFRFDGLAINKDPAPGTGHWHVYVDGKYAGLGVSNVIEIPNEAYPSISAGQHTLTISLHQNNHALTNPPVQHDFKINVTKDLNMEGGIPAAAGPGAGTSMSPQATASAGSPMTAMPNTGQQGSNWLLPLVAVLVCVLGGAALVYFSRRGRVGP